jgi:hypothetical protein
MRFASSTGSSAPSICARIGSRPGGCRHPFQSTGETRFEAGFARNFADLDTFSSLSGDLAAVHSLAESRPRWPRRRCSGRQDPEQGPRKREAPPRGRGFGYGGYPPPDPGPGIDVGSVEMRRRRTESRCVRCYAPRAPIIGGVMPGHPPARLQPVNFATAPRHESSGGEKRNGRDKRGRV